MKMYEVRTNRGDKFTYAKDVYEAMEKLNGTAAWRVFPNGLTGLKKKELIK